MDNINYTYRLIIFTLLALLVSTVSYGQNCSKKKLASKEMREDYDYRGQSLFVEMANGDSTNLKIVLYSKQNYKIFVVGEQKIGQIDYQIYVPRKKFNRVVKEIKPKTVSVYKKDPEGFYLYNNSGNRIEIGKETIQDTIWTRETADIEELVYDSKNAEFPYWLATPNKTQLVTIKVSAEVTDKIIMGCVGLYVGREYSNIYQFRR